MKRKAAGPIDMVFLGDSITDGWPRHGKDTWEKFAPTNPPTSASAGCAPRAAGTSPTAN